MQSSRVSARRRFATLLRSEPLESRQMLYNVTALPWDHTDLSFSLVPDGTQWDVGPSVLFSELDARYDRADWHREVASALQTWANHTNLNFHEVVDSGTPYGHPGEQGDIRLASAFSYQAPAYAVLPRRSLVGIGGDVTLNSRTLTLNGGILLPLQPILIHEFGHSLGLRHEHENPSVMRAHAGTSLFPDDIAGIQSLYGVRQDDPFDAAARNDTLHQATLVEMPGHTYSVRADLTSFTDVDFYEITVPTGERALTATVDASGLSLLAPEVSVFDASGDLVASSHADYGGTATVHAQVAPGTYYVRADGATSDKFQMGAYHLSIEFAEMTFDATPPLQLPSIQPPPTDSQQEPSPPQEPSLVASSPSTSQWLHEPADQVVEENAADHHATEGHAVEHDHHHDHSHGVAQSHPATPPFKPSAYEITTPNVGFESMTLLPTWFARRTGTPAPQQFETEPSTTANVPDLAIPENSGHMHPTVQSNEAHSAPRVPRQALPVQLESMGGEDIGDQPLGGEEVLSHSVWMSARHIDHVFADTNQGLVDDLPRPVSVDAAKVDAALAMPESQDQLSRPATVEQLTTQVVGLFTPSTTTTVRHGRRMFLASARRSELFDTDEEVSLLL